MLHWPRIQRKGYHTSYHKNVPAKKTLPQLPNTLEKTPITQTITHALPATISALPKKNEKQHILCGFSWNTTFSNGFAWRVLKHHVFLGFSTHCLTLLYISIDNHRRTLEQPGKINHTCNYDELVSWCEQGQLWESVSGKTNGKISFAQTRNNRRPHF